MKKICIVLGTRPEIIKLSPIIRECEKRKLNYFIIHTNQHYSKNLDDIFFKELNLPIPRYNLNVGSGSQSYQIGKMLIRIEKILIQEKPDLVLVQGDTNSVLAGALCASRLKIKIGHIEAGLRSYDKDMPEEINRILTDHISDFLFTPTKNQKRILIREGIKKRKIFVVGNTIVDAVFQNINISNKKSKIFKDYKIKKGCYFLLTLHRPSNVDNKKNFNSILKGLYLIYKKYKFPILFPIHPRTKKMLEEFNLSLPKGIILLDPVGYLEFLQLEKNAKLILTDSGGIQEEACILKTPCVTLRKNTERPETIKVKANKIAGIYSKNMIKCVDLMIKKKNDWKNPFGDGKAAEKILRIMIPS
jgi:UDP-N-acetylglucosamine 2-epimerase (non-hydrolysing)